MNKQTETSLIDGPAGALEIALDRPEAFAGQAAPLRGIAFISHPHPLYGGTMDNKVAQTLARAFLQLGYLAARLNFRGVGRSAGEHDRGQGEQDDLLALIAHVRADPALAQLPYTLAGFSFGAYVTAEVAQRLAKRDAAPERLVLVGTPALKWAVPEVPPDSLVIHGEQDETIPLADTLQWAAPLDLPVVVIPTASHFFHGKLNLLKRIVVQAWRV